MTKPYKSNSSPHISNKMASEARDEGPKFVGFVDKHKSDIIREYRQSRSSQNRNKGKVKTKGNDQSYPAGVKKIDKWRKIQLFGVCIHGVLIDNDLIERIGKNWLFSTAREAAIVAYKVNQLYEEWKDRRSTGSNKRLKLE